MSFINSAELTDDDGPFDGLPGVDKRSCSLLGPTALIVQGLMGVLVILSLVYKRHRETPKRPWRIWLFDVSKQVAGQMFVHGVNVLISDQVAHRSSGNACVFYFLNILIDTTLGVAIIYLIIHASTYILSEKMQFKGFQSGQYGDPPSINYWARQAAVYVFALTTMKLLVVALFALVPGIFKLGEWLLSWTRTGDEGDVIQVVFTMGIFPVSMNVVQFWLIDSIVKASNFPSPLTLPEDSLRHSEDREPLFAAGSDDEDDDARARPPHDIENPSVPRSRSQEDVKSSISDSGVDEPKSGGTSLPPRDILAHNSGVHSYPPSIADVSPSSSYMSSHSRPVSTSPKPKHMRKVKPPPLRIRPSAQPAVNSPEVIRPAVQAPIPVNLAAAAQQVQADNAGTEWGLSWDDADDWAKKVGEEDWTGRRLEEKKEAIHGVWDLSAIHTAPSNTSGS